MPSFSGDNDDDDDDDDHGSWLASRSCRLPVDRLLEVWRFNAGAAWLMEAFLVPDIVFFTSKLTSLPKRFGGENEQKIDLQRDLKILKNRFSEADFTDH